MTSPFMAGTLSMIFFAIRLMPRLSFVRPDSKRLMASIKRDVSRGRAIRRLRPVSQNGKRMSFFLVAGRRARLRGLGEEYTTGGRGDSTGFSRGRARPRCGAAPPAMRPVDDTTESTESTESRFGGLKRAKRKEAVSVESVGRSSRSKAGKGGGFPAGRPLGGG